MMHDMDISERVDSASELSRLRQNGNSEMTRTQPCVGVMAKIFLLEEKTSSESQRK